MVDELRKDTFTPRILLAEDDREMRRLVGHALQKDGWLVVEAEDGAALLTELEQRTSNPDRRVDLIVSDVRMPGSSGMDILAAMRRMGVRTPVILMTAFGDAQTRARAEALDALLFDKPFDVDDLREVVAGLLAR